MNDERDMQAGQDACPKRLWVMLTLSDDEALDTKGELPLGLRVHLKRCESCRRLSEQLLAVSAGLERLGRTEPPLGSFQGAEGRLVEAVRAGAGLRSSGATIGRDTDPAGMPRERRRPRSWPPVARYAAAAAIALAITLPPLWRAGFFASPPITRATGTNPAAANAPEPQSLATTERRSPQREPEAETRPPSEKTVQLTPQPRERLVSAPERQETPKRTFRPRICTFDSFADFSGPEDANCIYRGFPLPRQQKSPRNRR